ncbi:hypothetical protein AMECASPLE_004937 [Ameca splendens]|uniref:Uncharacterized protein n=1 Tax=Ameca splendens TaxID=208324 RepID=A0ABV0ZVU8_9TELE
MDRRNRSSSSQIGAAKRSYSEKLKSSFSANDAPAVWRRLNDINYRSPSPIDVIIPDWLTTSTASSAGLKYRHSHLTLALPCPPTNNSTCPIPSDPLPALKINEEDVNRFFQPQKTP